MSYRSHLNARSLIRRSVGRELCRHRPVALLASIGALLGTGQMSHAQQPGGEESATGDGLDEIVVVRSRNRLEPLQDVPLSISVVTGAELERESALDLSDFTKRAANITWNSGNPRQSSISIRGVGKQGQTDAQDPSVGIIVDGVSYAYNALSFYDFTDVEAVEVTRGPQGTLLGKNTTMGVVNIVTRRPSFTPDASYSLTFGKDDTIIGKAAGGGPIIDDLLAWRGTFYVDKQAGAYPNVYDNGDRSHVDKNRMAGRVQLLFTPTADFSARLSADVAPRSGENTNGLTFNKPSPAFYSDGSPVNLANDASTRLARRWFTQQSNYTYLGDYIGAGERGTVNNDSWRPLVTGSTGYSAYLDWNLGGYTLTSISAYKDYYFDARNDEGTPFDITLNGNTTVHYKQASQELRLTSPAGGRFDYQTGLYLLNSENEYNAKANWGSDAGAWFATGGQYTTLDADGSGRYLLENSLSRLFTLQTDSIDNKSIAAFGQVNWHVTEPLTITAGARFTREDRNNHTRKVVTDNGYGAELNPVAVNGVNLGGFNSNGTTGALVMTGAGNTVAQLSLADFVASKYFGAVATGVPGEAYNSLTNAQRAQVAAAKSLRASQIGTLWADVDGETFEEVQPAYVLSPAWKINDRLTAYVSYQYGEKAGIVQFTNGLPNNTRPEKSTAYELGLKSVLFDRTLVLNADIFLNDLRDYQQSVRVLDAYTTNLRNDNTLYYASATGNVPKVRVQGLEIDGTYSGIRNTSIRFNAAYNDAVYEDFRNAAQPSENGYANALPYRDVTGKNLPGAAKWTFSVGTEYQFPLANGRELHTSFNHFYTTKYNADNSLSEYGIVDAYGITDFSLGYGPSDRSFDVSLVVKNLTDTQYLSMGNSWTAWTPNNPRWYGITLSGKL